jgi:hypothetical protein
LDELCDLSLYSLEFLFGRRQARPRGHPQTLGLPSEFLAELLKEVSPKEFFLKRVKDA